MPHKSKRSLKSGNQTNSSLLGEELPAEWDSLLPLPKLSFPVAAVVVAVLAVLCFYQSCWARFTLDDREAILYNNDLRPETPVTNLLWHDFWGYNITLNGSHKSYRPLTVLTMRWNYIMAGGLKPNGFHITNVAIHPIVCVLVLKIVSVMYAGIISQNDQMSSFPFPRASLLTALLFAVHPVHTESVTANVGRADLLCALFFFLSMWTYVIACNTDDNDKESTESCLPPRKFSLPLVGMAVLFAVLAMLSKEHGITVLGVLAVYDYVVICRRRPFEILNIFVSKYRRENSPWLKPFLLRVIILCSSTVTLLGIRYVIMDTGAPYFPSHINPTSHAPFLTRVLTFPYLYALNCWILLNPWWLCHDWSDGCIPLISTPLDPRTLVSVMFFIFLVSFSIYALFGHMKENRLVFVAMLLLVIPFLPASNMFFYVGFVIAERTLYIPLLGYAMLVTLGMVKLCEKYQKQFYHFIGLFMLVTITLYTVRSMHRTNDWLNDDVLHRSAIKVCPLSSKIHFNIGKNSDDAGKKEEAEKWYRQAISINPDHRGAHLNLANILMPAGKTEEAKVLLERCRELGPTQPNVWLSLGNLYKDNYKDFNAATEYYDQAEQLARKYTFTDGRVSLAGIHNNQALVKREVGKVDEAIELWIKATQLDKTFDIAWFSLMETLVSLERYNEVLEAGKVAVVHVPFEKTRSIRALMGKAYASQNKLVATEKYFKQVVGMDQRTVAEDYYNLGILYDLMGKTKEAIYALERSLQVDPNYHKSTDSLKILRGKSKAKNKH
ncbi:protein O-mannosyl-transferase TMTC4-like isoform X1 [Glandiceps talaboti]